MEKVLAVLVLVTAAAGCAVRPLEVDPPADHPANPEAAAGRPALIARSLRPTVEAGSQTQEAEGESGHNGHDGHGEHGGHSREDGHGMNGRRGGSPAPHQGQAPEGDR